MARFTYGGQALIEGVMMRGRDAVAVAVRVPDGRIAVESESLVGSIHTSRAARLPLLRGLVVLWEQVGVGMKWIFRSSAVGLAEQGVELGSMLTLFSLLVALVFVLGLFLVLPLLLTGVVLKSDNGWLSHLFEGGVRIALLLGYLALVGRTKQLGRVFRYHGAEHMSIHALEAGESLTVDNVRQHPTAHPRCGTEFLVLVFILAILAFALIGRGAWWFTLSSRFILIPVLAGVSYELLRFLARHRDRLLFRALAAPGIWLQMITTKQPDDAMIEVAITALRQALVADNETIPPGSLELATVPLTQVLAESKAAFEAAEARKATEAAHKPE